MGNLLKLMLKSNVLCLEPPNGKTEHSTESGDSSLQSHSKSLSNGVLYTSVAVPVLKLRMLKVACLQSHNVIGKKQISPIGF